MKLKWKNRLFHFKDVQARLASQHTIIAIIDIH